MLGFFCVFITIHTIAIILRQRFKRRIRKRLFLCRFNAFLECFNRSLKFIHGLNLAILKSLRCLFIGSAFESQQMVSQTIQILHLTHHFNFGDGAIFKCFPFRIHAVDMLFKRGLNRHLLTTKRHRQGF